MVAAVKSPRRQAKSAPAVPRGPRSGARLLFFDGRGASCNRWVRWLLRRDRGGRLVAAPLQGRLAVEVLSRHGLDPAGLETLVLVEGYGTRRERVRVRSDGVVACLRTLGGMWKALAVLASWFPRGPADRLYDRLAHSRYRGGGKLEACPRVEPELAGRILVDEPDGG